MDHVLSSSDRQRLMQIFSCRCLTKASRSRPPVHQTTFLHGNSRSQMRRSRFQRMDAYLSPSQVSSQPSCVQKRIKSPSFCFSSKERQRRSGERGRGDPEVFFWRCRICPKPRERTRSPPATLSWLHWTPHRSVPDDSPSGFCPALLFICVLLDPELRLHPDRRF